MSAQKKLLSLSIAGMEAEINEVDREIKAANTVVRKTDIDSKSLAKFHRGGLASLDTAEIKMITTIKLQIQSLKRLESGMSLQRRLATLKFLNRLSGLIHDRIAAHADEKGMVRVYDSPRYIVKDRVKGFAASILNIAGVLFFASSIGLAMNWNNPTLWQQNAPPAIIHQTMPIEFQEELRRIAGRRHVEDATIAESEGFNWRFSTPETETKSTTAQSKQKYDTQQ